MAGTAGQAEVGKHSCTRRSRYEEPADGRLWRWLQVRSHAVEHQESLVEASRMPWLPSLAHLLGSSARPTGDRWHKPALRDSEESERRAGEVGHRRVRKARLAAAWGMQGEGWRHCIDSSRGLHDDWPADAVAAPAHQLHASRAQAHHTPVIAKPKASAVTTPQLWSI